MALLDGFKLIELKEKIEESTLTISAKALRFNRGTARDVFCKEEIFKNRKKIPHFQMWNSLFSERGIPK